MCFQENGTTFYEGTDKAEQVVGFLETQSFQDITQQTKELVKLMKKGDKTFETLVIDSETKIYENLQEALLTVDEKRAREKGQDALDANISMRSWGKIKQKARSMQNLKLQLASTGMNIVSIAQPKDTMEDLGNGKRIKVGIEPDMKKQAKFDYDVVLRFYTEDGKYYAQVEKDRTEAHLRDEIIENPSFEDWAEVIADRKDLMTIWRKSPYFSEGMDSLSLGLVESYFLYALYFWSLTYLSTTSLLMLPREPR